MDIDTRSYHKYVSDGDLIANAVQLCRFSSSSCLSSCIVHKLLKKSLRRFAAAVGDNSDAAAVGPVADALAATVSHVPVCK